MARLLVRPIVLAALACAALAWTALATSAFAAGEPPKWRQTLTCEPTAQHYRGLEYCTAENGRIHVIVVDLHSAGIRLEYVIAHGVDASCKPGAQCTPTECQDVNRSTKGLLAPRGPGCDDPIDRNHYPVMSLDKAVGLAHAIDANTAVVIDSDYGARSAGGESFFDHGPEGLAIVRGKRIDGPAVGDYDAPGQNPATNNAVRRPALSVSKAAPIRAEIGQLASDDGGKPDWIYTAVGGAPWMIQAGAVTAGSIASCEGAPGSCYKGAAQTAVGLSQDGRWLFLAVDERQGTLQQFAEFMDQSLDAWNAMKFDGGGSSKLWYHDAVLLPGDARQLSQYLAVAAQSGAGIADQAPGVSPGDEAQIRLEAWWQGLVSDIEAWWERTRTQIEAAVAAWAEQQWQKFLSWLETELTRQVDTWLRQTCGINALAPVAAILWVARRRRR